MHKNESARLEILTMCMCVLVGHLIADCPDKVDAASSLSKARCFNCQQLVSLFFFFFVEKRVNLTDLNCRVI